MSRRYRPSMPQRRSPLRRKAADLWWGHRESYCPWLRTLTVRKCAFLPEACTWWYEVTDPADPFLMWALVQTRRPEMIGLDLVYGKESL